MVLSLVEIENVLMGIVLGKIWNLYIKYVEFKIYVGALEWKYLWIKIGKCQGNQS